MLAPPPTWIKQYWWIPGIGASFGLVGAFACLACVRTRNKNRRGLHTDQRLQEWEAAMARHRVEQLDKRGSLLPLGADFLDGIGAGLRKTANRLSAALRRPLSLILGAPVNANVPPAGYVPASTAEMVEKKQDTEVSIADEPLEDNTRRRTYERAMQGSSGNMLGNIPEDEDMKEADLIRFSSPPVQKDPKEGDLMRFSLPPIAGGSKDGGQVRSSTEKINILQNSSGPAQPTSIPEESALPQRLQLNYNTDLRIGEPLPSNSKEKRIYGGTLAKDQGFIPRRVAIKHVWRNAAESDEQASAAFVREVTIMAALATNENVARIVGYCTVPRIIVTDLYEGDLDFILGNRRFELPDARAVSILGDVAKALTATHEMGFAHGRVRPGAVLLERVKNPARVSVRNSILTFGQSQQPRTFWRARLNDFSISRPDGESESKARIAPRYAAPECILTDKQITTAGDVYSFGVLIWQCLTRRIPWEGQEDGYIVWKICEGERFNLGEVVTGASIVRKELLEIVHRCLAPEPFVRPTMGQILATLEKLK
ncbi:hypothetical protein SpCBS45565_g02163 [Spizellomyces sp. 'palustris']|nr:hypothetical protein SpCBS45565_g02163 [Spizellomyces sp. 'palustris']